MEDTGDNLQIRTLHLVDVVPEPPVPVLADEDRLVCAVLQCLEYPGGLVLADETAQSDILGVLYRNNQRDIAVLNADPVKVAAGSRHGLAVYAVDLAHALSGVNHQVVYSVHFYAPSPCGGSNTILC